MKTKFNSKIIHNNTDEKFKRKHKYQVLEDYWKKRKKECEKSLSKFC